jgi:diguanylate cyclase (GGDEF)-like protein
MMYGTHEDITNRKASEERIRHLATHDALTGLPGLRLANERLSWSLSLARRQKSLTAVMFIDLDGFKTVNDTLGHESGDFVLKAIARRMQSCIRETDTIARVGGDEFLLIATALNSSRDAAEIARKIVDQVARPVLINEHSAVVGASVGIAVFPTHSRDADELVRLADKAMYKIKASGKNAFGFAEK